MHNALDEWRGRENALTRWLLGYPFADEVAREMMRHGMSRRIADLKHSLDRIFEILPPDAEAPSRRDLYDATAFLQAFVINTFGAIDNLAWVWAREANVRDKRDRPLVRSLIGLTPDHQILRGSLSEKTQAYLQSLDPWFEYQEEYRHALAHRIPLYIPPKTFNDADAAEHKRLEDEMLAEGWSWERWHEVEAAQRRLGVFEPVMMHSYGERARPMYFHAQTLIDFATVIEIAEHVAGDLDMLGDK
ncbi:MAG: hypothetical protein CFE28_00400 [Alphaproteobacteria bacterium PA2]|nr:MAG: hypothetical protein CFE28_00400 [Alphaproteobacteria bacterium PA2]